jgi:hypothetical protein
MDFIRGRAMSLPNFCLAAPSAGNVGLLKKKRAWNCNKRQFNNPMATLQARSKAKAK